MNFIMKINVFMMILELKIEFLIFFPKNNFSFFFQKFVFDQEFDSNGPGA